MPGVKGRSGGARPGAGRKRKPETPTVIPVEPQLAAKAVALEAQPHGGALQRDAALPVDVGDMDMLQMLQAVALGRVAVTALQVRAAVAAVQYTHTKRHDGGKKEDIADAAKKAGGGKFASKAPPKLVVSNG